MCVNIFGEAIDTVEGNRYNQNVRMILKKMKCNMRRLVKALRKIEQSKGERQ